MSFRLAAQESMLRGQSLQSKYDFALSVGFDGIELSGRGGGVFAARAEELAQARRDGVVMPSAVVAMPDFVGAFDPEARRRAIEDVKALLSTLPHAGAQGLVMPNGFAVFSRVLPPFDAPRSQHASREALVEALVELGEHAHREGVEVYLEPLNRYEDYLINTLADAASVVAEVGSPGVSVIADTFHMAIEEADVATSLRAAGPVVHHVQLGDTDRLEPGHGHYDWDATLEALEAIGYTGWLAMECGLSGDPERVLPAVSELLKR